MSDQDHLLDHSYDGIQEYDNPLPGWWVYVFWATIIFSVFYVGYYHIGVGPTIQDEYARAASMYFEKQAAQFAGKEITEAFIYELSTDPNRMKAIAQKFQANCATCHGPSGEGLVGPNLTDDQWLHGGTLMDIHRVIETGVAGTEMKAWLPQLGPYGVLAMSAYVGTELRGRNLPGRAPEGRSETWTPPVLPVSTPASGQ